MGRQSLTRAVGKGSREQVEVLAELTSLASWRASTGEKEERLQWESAALGVRCQVAEVQVVQVILVSFAGPTRCIVLLEKEGAKRLKKEIK